MSRESDGTRSAADGIVVKKVGIHLAAEIGGLDLRLPLNDDTRRAIHDAVVEHALIIFHDQDITSDQLIAFGERFGELSVHPFSPNDEERPELIRFENTEDNPPAMTDVWHSDETFRREPPMGTVLRAREVPEIGGDTVFASMSAAYEGLSDRMQQFVSGLEAIHDLKPFKALFDDMPEGREDLRHIESLFPPVSHPVLRVHPVSGRKALFVNRQFTLRIKEMDERESQSLLDTLFHQALIPEYQFRHRWRPHTVVFWDNRSAQHYAVHDYYPRRRIMERVTIKGDRPVCVGTADPATVRRAKSTGRGAAGHAGHRPPRRFERGR